MAFITSGFAVGYDSPSQFSRGYNRVYGAPSFLHGQPGVDKADDGGLVGEDPDDVAVPLLYFELRKLKGGG
jgi:hypothetical protein